MKVKPSASYCCDTHTQNDILRNPECIYKVRRQVQKNQGAPNKADFYDKV